MCAGQTAVATDVPGDVQMCMDVPELAQNCVEVPRFVRICTGTSHECPIMFILAQYLPGCAEAHLDMPLTRPPWMCQCGRTCTYRHGPAQVYLDLRQTLPRMAGLALALHMYA